MTEPKKFTLLNGKIRLDKCGGKPVLSPKPNTTPQKDCCCECDTEELEEMKLDYYACHGCEAAVFGVMLSFNNTADDADWVRVGRVNLNTSLAEDGFCTYAPTVNVSQPLLKQLVKKKLPESQSNCCTLYARLRCETGGYCHSGAAALKVIRSSDGKVLYEGGCGESPISINVCPENSSGGPTGPTGL